MRRSTYSVTSCSGLMKTSTDKASSLKSCGRLVYSAERMRAIFVGVRNRVKATSHAIMFTSSLLVSATMMSASAAPAASNTVGYEAFPATVRMSSRSWRSRRISSSRSTTVTSLASSRERWWAAVRPTWPAPRMTIFIYNGSRFAYCTISHFVPWLSKLTWTRACAPLPSTFRITPSPNFPWRTRAPSRTPGDGGLFRPETTHRDRSGQPGPAGGFPR